MKKLLLFLVLGLLSFSACGSIGIEEGEEEKCIENYYVSDNGSREVYLDLVDENGDYISSYEAEDLEDVWEEFEERINVSWGHDEEAKLGKLNESYDEKLLNRKFVKDLIANEYIGVYQHLGANLCLKKEIDNDEEYEAFLEGVHYFCTNECIDEEFVFYVKLNKKTKEVFVGKDGS